MPISDEEAAEKMRDLADDDAESAHIAADELLTELLIELGYVKTVKSIPKSKSGTPNKRNIK